MLHWIPRAAGLAVLLAAGCATGPKIYTSKDPAVDLASFETYGFVPELGTDRSDYSSLLSRYLKAAASRELELRGYRPGADPDLLVNFYVNTKEKVRTSQTPTGAGYYGYRYPYYGAWGGYETTVSQYTEGTLTVDLVDAGEDQLVWEGTATGRITDEVRENLQPAVDQAVSAIFARFPVPSR